MSGFLFNCFKNNEKLLYDDFQTNFISTSDRPYDSKLFIGPDIYNKEAIFEEIDIILGHMQREWFLLQSIVLYDNILLYDEIVYAREIINKSFAGIKESLQICKCPIRKAKYKKRVSEELKCLLNIVISVNDLKDNFVIKLCSWKDNDVTNPIYQYFHTLLEMEYYLLFLNYLCDVNTCIIEDILVKILSNFIQFSKINFQRQTGQVFVCPCIKKFWLLIQFFLEKTNPETDYFWKLFNKKLESEESMFSLWLLSEIAALQLVNENLVLEGNLCSRIKPNYELLLTKLKCVLINADSDVLLKLLKVINPLLTNYWLKDAKVEIYQTIWDFYSKRLNISKKNYLGSSALDLNNLLNHIISCPANCNEDFEHFTGILIYHLNKHPSHWGKMKGRMYSQLGPNKIKDLNEVGIVHVMFLFSSLSTLHYEELLKKIILFLEGLAQEKKNNPLIWNLLIAFLFMQVKRGLTLDKTAPVLLSWIQEASLDHKHFHLIKCFVSNFEHILNFSLNMQLHQWLLLDSWLTKYLLSCYHADMTIVLDVLLIILEKVENSDSWSFWFENFRNHVYPSLKQLAHTHNAPGSIGIIAGKMCLLIPSMHSEIFSYFTSDNISYKIGLNFLTVALADYPNSCILNAQQEIYVIQTWIKICLLTTDPVNSLTKIVVKLDCFPLNLKIHLNSSQDPIKAFIEYLGSDLNAHRQSNNINRLCEVSFGNIDKWLNQYLANPESDTVVLKIYVCISLAFLHCGPLLYHRNRSSSPLTKLLECLLLSSDFLIGKTPHEYVLNAVKKTWHIFYEAIVKLKDDADMFLERALRDLITKYMQHFSTNDSPILKCLENEATAKIVLEKISNSYFKHPVKESDNNLIKVIKILSDTIQSTTLVSLLKLIIIKVLCGLFELIIFHPQRNLAINLIKVISLSPLYSQVKTEFSSSIIATTERHLGFNATNYFQMMYILAKFVPGDVKNIIGKISQQIVNVERLRGVGYDINLRSQLEKLENIVKEA